jgi:hypothetical protein
MTRLRHALSAFLPVFVALDLILWGPAAEGVDMGQVKSEICKARASCRLTALKTAGQSEAGVSLFVAEVALGLADKPPDGPDTGCLSSEADNDGGREYWLIEEGKDPKLVLKLCNDGYGAAQVGDDQVEISRNRLTHIQYGGSNDRWEVTETIRLSPRKSLSMEDCGFRASDPIYAVLSWIDVPAMAAHSVAIDDAAKSEAASDDPCSLLRGQMVLPARPGFLLGVDVLLPDLGGDGETPQPGFVAGTILGSCASRLTLGDSGNYIVFGQADKARPAEIAFLALDRKTLILQIFDARPDGTATKSWAAADHFELWTTEDPGMVNHANPAKVKQLGIGLDGTVYAGVGEPKLPKVDRWQGIDGLRRPVTVLRLAWPDTDALVGGVTIAYSEAEAGRQARIFATGAIVRNRPLYLPNIDDVPVTCGIQDGRWDVTNNPGRLQGIEIAN